MRTAYVWGLCLVMLVTLGVAWWDSRSAAEHEVVAPIVKPARLNEPVMAVPAEIALIDTHDRVSAAVTINHSAIGLTAWAMHRSLWPPALRDIFAWQQPIRPVVPSSALPLMTPSIEVAPEPNVRFLGRFVNPQGTASVYLQQADKEMEAKLGETLPNGYVVESFTQEELHLVYPRLDTRVVVPLGSEP